jgi:hypothetical protein
VSPRAPAGAYRGVGAAVGAAPLAGVALAGGMVASIDVGPDRFDSSVFPVDAVAKARAERLEGTMFNNFIWGGYLLLAWPEQRVFIDGGTDHYGEKLFQEYIQVWNLDPGWREVMQRWGITIALVPPRSRLADELARDLGWRVWYCDSTAVILRGRVDSGGASPESDSAFASCSRPQHRKE